MQGVVLKEGLNLLMHLFKRHLLNTNYMPALCPVLKIEQWTHQEERKESRE